MIYVANVTTPKDQAKADPLVSSFSVSKGLVYRVEIDFPPGVCGLLYIALFDGSYQVWPSSPEIYFHTSHGVIGFDDLYLKDNPPFEFQIKTYNLDTVFDHFCQVRIGLVSKEEFQMRFLPALGWQKYEDMLTRIREAQEQRISAILGRPFMKA